ncbi:unnamed protein product [Ranitomeya imitator]|uniref:Group XIIB secretory phospholipase A2-like protein n=1 Tax=Ranitomeya imitator TaxID=111125 RepID=A0ABN9LTE7_9NEOB|nr:unnamed protein product [Ranitomeya imitator]
MPEGFNSVAKRVSPNRLRFFKVATFCFDDCFAHSWHSLDELQEVVTGNGFHFIGYIGGLSTAFQNAVDKPLMPLDMGIPAMTKCCNQLDICYDTCGANKYRCDAKFRWCLHSICSDLKKSLGFVSKVEALQAAGSASKDAMGEGPSMTSRSCDRNVMEGPALIPILGPDTAHKRRNYNGLFGLQYRRSEGHSAGGQTAVACESMADTVFNTVWTLGCRPFMNSQRSSCICNEEEREEL